MTKDNTANKKRSGKDGFLQGALASDERFKVITGLFILSFSVYSLFGYVSYLFSWKADQSKLDISFIDQLKDATITVENWAGKLGANIAYLLIHNWFGLASISFILIFGLLGLRMLNLKILSFKKTVKYSLVYMFWLSITLGFVFHKSEFQPGGAHGYFMSQWLMSFIGGIGTAFLLLFILFGLLSFTFDGFIDHVKLFIRKTFTKEALNAEIDDEVFTFEDTAESTDEPNENDPVSDPVFENINNFDQADDMAPEHEGINTDNLDPLANLEMVEIKSPEQDPDDNDEITATVNLSFEKSKTETKTLNDDALDFSVEIAENDEDDNFDISNLPQGEYDPTLELSKYTLPGIDMLEEHDSKNVSVTTEELNSNKDRIVETLGNYKIEIIDIKAIVGPTITLYEIVPAPGIRISKIKNLEDDIALSLAALGIRIIAPIPGKGTIGIEVPNLKPKVVSMRSIIASKAFQESKYDLPLALGKTISNETFVIDLAKMPHMLVAGATGQGKSVGLNAILTSLLYKKHPSQLKLVLVDPKKVELTLYQKIEKHFLAMLPDAEEAIITDTQKVVNTLNSLCVEMDSRYDLLKAAHVRNIKEYNAKFISRHLNPEKGHKFLPYIVVIIDEFADLIMTAGKEVELPIARLAQLARAIGIHLIIATQRPTTNIITGLIKANFPARIAFRVMSMMDSRTILDSPGANQLIGRGDMLISQGSDVTRLQCAFIDTPEIEKIATFIQEQQSYPTPFYLPEYVDENTTDLSDIDLSKRDAMFEDAARLIVANQQGSTSLIQRKFSIGYNRAGRIIDQLEAAGIVGPFEGSKARQVLISDEHSLEQLLSNLQN